LNFWTRNNSEKREKQIPAPWPIPIHNLSLMPKVWNVAIGQPGLAAWLYSLPAPAHLLVPEGEKLEKVLDFIATTKTSVLTLFSY